MAQLALPPLAASRRTTNEIALAALLGLAILVALATLPAKAAIAVVVVAAFGVFVLFDAWHAVLLLLAARASLDVLSDVAVAGSLNGAALLTGMMIIVGLEHIATRRVQVLDLPLAKPMLALLAVSALTVVIAPDPRLAFEHWLRLLSTVLLFFLIVEVVRVAAERRKLIGALLLSAAIPVLAGLYQLAAGDGNQNTEGFNRIFGTFVHPSPFGVYLLTLLPVTAVVFLHGRPGWSKLGLGLLAVAMAVCALFTFTRIVWLGAIAIVMVLGLGKTRAVLLVLPVIVVLAFLLLPSVQQRFEGATETTGFESTGAWRIRHWDDQLRYNSLASLPLGSGLGTVEHVLGQPAHNDYLRIWVEVGVLGSIAYVWLYGSLIKGAVSNYRGARSPEDRSLLLAFLALLAGRLVMSLTDNLLIQPVLEWYFWGIAAIALSLRQARDLPSPVRASQRGRA